MQSDSEGDPYSTVNPYPSQSQVKWHGLYKLAPELRRLHLDAFANLPPPSPTTRKDFLSLCACFCDPQRREALRALIFDLLADDFIELLQYSREEKPS